jgi:hypothetical protein
VKKIEIATRKKKKEIKKKLPLFVPVKSLVFPTK